MKRRGFSALLVLLFLIFTIGLPSHGWGAVFRAAGNAYRPAYRGPNTAVSGVLTNPALIGGVSFSLTNP